MGHLGSWSLVFLVATIPWRLGTLLPGFVGRLVPLETWFQATWEDSSPGFRAGPPTLSCLRAALSRPFVGREESRARDRARIPGSSPSARPGDPRDSSGTRPVEAGGPRGPRLSPMRREPGVRAAGGVSVAWVARCLLGPGSRSSITLVHGTTCFPILRGSRRKRLSSHPAFWRCQDEGTSAPGRPIAPVSKRSRSPCGLGSRLSKVPWHVDSGTSCSAMHLGPKLSCARPVSPWNLEHDGSLSNLGPGTSWSPGLLLARFPVNEVPGHLR